MSVARTLGESKSAVSMRMLTLAMEAATCPEKPGGTTSKPGHAIVPPGEGSSNLLP